MNATYSVHCLVQGRVQGVGYRYFAYRAANKLGLVGWVKNLPKGDVEVLAQGPKKVLITFVQHLASGPTWSKVAQVHEEWTTTQPTYSEFQIRT